VPLTPILWATLLPAFLAGFFLLVAWRPWRREATRWGSWIEPPALGAAFVAGQVSLVGWPPFPPIESTHGLFYLALAAAGVGAIESLSTAPSLLRGALRALLAFGAPALLLRSRLRGSWTPFEGAAWIGILGASILAFHAAVRAAARRLTGPSRAALLFVPVAAASGVLVLYGSALLSQLAGALASALGAGLVLSWLNPAVSFRRGSTTVVAILLGSLLTNGVFYAEVTVPAAALIGLSPLACLLALRAARLRNLAPRPTALAVGAVLGIPCAAAIGLALLSFLTGEDS
jgi:hypothetical protein